MYGCVLNIRTSLQSSAIVCIDLLSLLEAWTPQYPIEPRAWWISCQIPNGGPWGASTTPLRSNRFHVSKIAAVIWCQSRAGKLQKRLDQNSLRLGSFLLNIQSALFRYNWKLFPKKTSALYSSFISTFISTIRMFFLNNLINAIQGLQAPLRGRNPRV